MPPKPPSKRPAKTAAGSKAESARSTVGDPSKGAFPKTLDAPSWLWSSIVELVVPHEKAYLAHCRRYALEVDKELAAAA